MKDRKVDLLARKWKNGSISVAEKQEFENWYRLVDDAELEVYSYRSKQALSSAIYKRIAEKAHIPMITKRKRSYIRQVAAILILVFLTGFLANLYFRNKAGLNSVNTNKKVLAPGGNRAFLTLGDGTRIVLDNMVNGKIASQGNSSIVKPENGQLNYLKGTKGIKEILYNTMTTPNGGQYRLILSDGTKVWLNAGSSITYPIEFTGEKRNVSVTGEVYFEVAKNKNMPFFVKAAGQTIEVLGTHFNINAYTDEAAIKTTLVEGSVKVYTDRLSAVIKPGEQSILENGIIKVQPIDSEEFTGWKDGFFRYKDADIKTIMRAFAHWYDVEVVYEGKIPQRKFTIEVHRNISADRALEILKFLKINFRIESRKIIIIN